MSLPQIVSAVGARIDITLTTPDGKRIIMAFEARSTDSQVGFEISNEINDDAGWTDGPFVSQFLTGRHGFKLTGEALHMADPQ